MRKTKDISKQACIMQREGAGEQRREGALSMEVKKMCL
jgi:hypothetical protein